MERRSDEKQKKSGWLWVGGSVMALFLLLLVVGGGYYTYANQVPEWKPTPVTMPIPNGYDDLVAAGPLLPTAAKSFDPTNPATDAELRDYLSKCDTAFARMRMGLKKECRVPAVGSFSQTFPELADFRSLARALSADGDLAMRERRYMDAAASYRDCLALGNKLSQGGTLIHHLVALAVHAIGNHAILSHADQFDAESAAWLAREMARLEKGRNTAADAFRGEKEFGSAGMMEIFTKKVSIKDLTAMSGSGTGPQDALLGVTYAFTPKRVIFRNYQEHMDRVIARAELPYAQRGAEPAPPKDIISQILIPVFAQSGFAIAKRDAQWEVTEARLALRAHQLERGRSPATLSALVPKYLPQTPEDPFTSKPLVYKTGSRPLIYSVGPDGVDNGGQDLGNKLDVSSQGDIVSMETQRDRDRKAGKRPKASKAK